MTRRKGFILSTSATVLAGLGLLGGAGYVLLQNIGAVNQLLNLVVGNLFYLTVASVAVLSTIFAIVMAVRGKIDSRHSIGIIILVMGFAVLAPTTGMALGNASGNYQATFVVSVDQPSLGTEPPSFSAMSVGEITKQTSIFSIQRKACIVGCNNWVVEVDVTCDGKTIGQAAATGKGTQTQEVSVRGLPPGASCTATGHMTTPSNHLGPNSIDKDFTVPGG